MSRDFNTQIPIHKVTHRNVGIRFKIYKNVYNVAENGRARGHVDKEFFCLCIKSDGKGGSSVVACFVSTRPQVKKGHGNTPTKEREAY